MSVVTKDVSEDEVGVIVDVIDAMGVTSVESLVDIIVDDGFEDVT